MSFLRYLLTIRRDLLTFAILFSLFAGISSAALVALISNSLIDFEALTARFVGYFIGAVGLVLGFNFLAKWFLIRLTLHTHFGLRIQLCQQIVATPLRQLEIIGQPRLWAALTDDVGRINRALNQLPTVCISFATVASCTAYLAWLSPIAFFILAGFMLPVMAGYWQLHKKVQRLFHEAFSGQAALFAHFKAATEGTKELKLHSQKRRRFFTDLLLPSASFIEKKLITSRTLQETAGLLSQGIYFLVILALFALVSFEQTTVTVLTNYVLIALYMRQAILSFVNTLPAWTQAMTAFEQIEALGFSAEALADPQTQSNETLPDTTLTTLKLQGIKHTYTQEDVDYEFTLGPLDLCFQAGEIVFLTGGNGSGKTTLIKVMTGLYEPLAGQLHLNDCLITDQNLSAYQNQFAAIFADFYLFEQLLGLDTVRLDEEATTLLSKLHLDHKVAVQDGHFSTTNLSYGQRKRLALLTALLEDRPIYIFDEWASGQDPALKHLFYHQYLPDLKAKGKLVIVVTHDDNYYDIADQVIKLEEGKIIRTSFKEDSQMN